MIGKILDLIDASLRYITVIVFATMLFLVVYQVFSRYVINYSFSWTEEITKYLFMWLVLLAAPLIVRRKANISITILIDNVPNPMKKIIEVCIYAISLTFLVILFFQSIVMIQEVGDLASAAARLPFRIIYLCLPIGTFLMMIYLIETFLKDILLFKNDKGESIQ